MPTGTWTDDGKSDKMAAGRENGHIAVANAGYPRVSTVDQDPALQLDAELLYLPNKLMTTNF